MPRSSTLAPVEQATPRDATASTPVHLVFVDGKLQPAGYIDTETAAAYAGYSKSVFDKLRQTGDGPAFFGPTSDPRYSYATIDEWMNRHRYTSTAAMREAKRIGGAA